ncbi:recombinase RecT [Burkholderia pseudomallei]
MPNIQDMKGDGARRQVQVATSLTEVEAFFKKNRDQIGMALPKHLNPDRMTRLALTALSQNPELRKCTMRSIFGEVVKASQIGLEIGVLGQGFLVPYWNEKKGVSEAQFIAGWQGLVDLVARAGRASVWTGAVFDGDEFDYSLGDAPFVKHKPCGEDDPAKITHVYAIGRVNGSQWPIIEVWPIMKVRRHRDRYNRVGQRHYSFKQWEMYARKVPLLQVLKYVPKSIELNMALAAEAAHGEVFTIDGDFQPIDPDQPYERGIEPDEPPPPPPPQTNGAADGTRGPTYAEIAEALSSASTLDELNEAADLVRMIEDQAHARELAQLYEARANELQEPPPDAPPARGTRKRNLD